ncbi:MAG: class B sortase [Oscillospiraceae bacterium]|nr:class B sortase [Oscillospiraceae bacterium]
MNSHETGNPNQADENAAPGEYLADAPDASAEIVEDIPDTTDVPDDDGGIAVAVADETAAEIEPEPAEAASDDAGWSEIMEMVDELTAAGQDGETDAPEPGEAAAKKPPRGRRVWQILAALCGCVSVAALVYIGYYMWNSFSHKSMGGKLADLYDSLPEHTEFQPPVFPSVAPISADTEDTAGGVEPPPVITEAELLALRELEGRVRFADLLEINEDFRGFLLIDGLGIKEPYVWAGTNTKYIRTDFEGKPSKHGCLFLNCYNNRLLTNKNNVIFGHKMTDGTMFAPLLKYRDPATVEKAPVIILDGLTGVTTWMVFAAYTCEPDYGYIDTHMSDSDFEYLLEEINDRSQIITNVDVNADDRVLSLSTCDYDFEDARFVVHARLLRDGEEIPVITAEKNPSPKPPVVPMQMPLDELPAERTAILRHSGNGKIYYYQMRRNGVNWYVGNTKSVQGPYSCFTGKPQADSTISAVYHSGIKQPFMAIDRLSDIPGVFLLNAQIPGGTFRLVQNTPVTPSGADARNPLIAIDGNDMWLLYTVANDEREVIYRLGITRTGAPVGDPEPLWEAPPQTGLRPIGYYIINGSYALIWQEADGVYGTRPGLTESKKLPFDIWDRVTLYGVPSGGKAPMTLELDGKISHSTFQMDWLPEPAPIPEPAPEPISEPDDGAGDEPETPPGDAGEPESSPEPA